MATAQPALRTIALSKSYGRRLAVDRLDLEVDRAELFGFLGPNGAGKTTTIRMALGLIAPSAGSVEILGREVRSSRSDVLPRVGALVESPALYGYMSGRDNLRVVGNLLGGVSEKRIDEVLEIVSLKDRDRDRVKTYSLGMKQRLGLAIAPLNNPDLLILDEPANGLDPAGIVEMRDLLRNLAAGGQNFKALLLTDPTSWAYDKLEAFGTVFQIGSGIFLLIVGSRLIGMEYSAGTIRIAYARGTGRLHLLVAKLLTLAVVGVVLLAGFVLVVCVILAVLISSASGGLDPVHQIFNAFWADLGRWALVQGLSMGIAILLAAAAAGLGRSLAFAMAASLAFFPADNFLVIIEALAVRATGHDHPWVDISQYQLGANLNVVLGLIEPGHRARPAFAQPLASVDATHALAVIGVFALLFAVIAVVRTVRPDVLE